MFNFLLFIIILSSIDAIGTVPAIAKNYEVQAKTGIEIQPDLSEGLPISRVEFLLKTSTGDSKDDETLIKQASGIFTLKKGDPFKPLILEMGLKKLRQLDSIQSVAYKLYEAVPSGQIIIVISILPISEAVTIPKHPSGMWASKDVRDFPTIFENNRSKFVFIFNGGVGVFSDTDPWFGGYGDAFNKNSPIADDPLGSGTSTWVEGYVEPGIGGISQIQEYPIYPYGAVTYLMSGTDGHDIYNSGTWGHGELEKLYAGIIWDLPGEKSVFDFSVGKQIYQLRDGFLLSKIPVSTSVGERGALYLGPRIASKNTVLCRAKTFGFGIDAFMIEPSELDTIKTDTRLLGINLQYQFRNIDTAFTYFYIPQSDSIYRTPDGRQLPREGVRTFNPSISITNLFGQGGLWIKGEYAYQNHEDFSMAAQAGYAWVGYQAEKIAWRPSVSYRWSIFTGDETDTKTFERFDPLFSGGLGNFLPGIVLSKVYKNANLVTNRATFSVKPSPTIELIIDYFNHRADEKNNLGGIGPLQTLSSKDIGQEVTLSVFNYIGSHLFFQGIASVGMPGDAIEKALEADAKNWYTLQAALYMFF